MAPLPSAPPRGLCSSIPLGGHPPAPKNQRVQRPEASSCRQTTLSTHDVDASNSEVYLTAREFKSWGGPAFQQLPCPVKEFILDIGVCHYLVLVQSPDGSVRQWDFGPCGGDVHVGIPGANTLRRAASMSLATVMHTEPLVPEDETSLHGEMTGHEPLHPVRGVPGEIREDLLPQLPSHAPVIHIGRTSLSAQDIREFNDRQPKYYLLHENDCRHYTNNLVHHMTGMQKGTSVFVRQQYLDKVGSSPLQHPHRPLIHAMQAVTDVSNWESMRRVTSLAAAALSSLCGARLWGGLRAAAPSRLAAGLASRALSKLVRPRAGALMTAAASRPSLPALAPVAVGAASLSASKAGGRHFGSRPQPWQDDAAMELLGLDLQGSSRHTQQRDRGTVEETKLAKISRVSQSVGAALAAYASTPAPLHLMHMLKQQVRAVRRMKSSFAAGVAERGGTPGTEQGAEGANAHSSALVRMEDAGASGEPGAGALMVQRPGAAAAHPRGPFSQAAAGGWGAPAASPGAQPAAAVSHSTRRSKAAPAPASCTEAVPPKLPSPSPARFFTRGSKTPFLSARAKAGAAAAVSLPQQQQARTRDAAFTAFSAALQQQAARWYL